MAAATAGPASQPDIAYTPCYEKYIARSKRRQESGKLITSLPTGFPQRLESDLVWDGQELANKFDWTYRLTDQDLKEIDAAVEHFKRLSSHVAPIRGRQDSTWDGKNVDVALAHIIDISRNVGLDNVGSPAYTTEKQVFHTDSGDVITLFCLGEAEEGGQSHIASSWFVYNELAAKRPDLIRTLAEPWEVDGYVKSLPVFSISIDNSSFGKSGQKSTFRPLLYHQAATDKHPERMIIQYGRRYFTGHSGLPRSSDIGPITEAQAEALDALHFLAEKHAVTLDFHKGDIQFANNLSLFHARAGFRDSKEKQRHLVRLWLRDPELAWETPGPLQQLWDRVYKDLDLDNTFFPIDPVMRDLMG
ncbi:hypothetical protein BFJ69_g13386 [Fusarium oxysporum]|uniref:TauD/TfdA-like domain-containing protein n=1 Tax=Fusarium oxysporum TaxID=5507 RepID=A0A420ML28_FUSOX|nr:hypothetical protein BFJ69_g13386 [Fusarium oxysporum]